MNNFFSFERVLSAANRRAGFDTIGYCIGGVGPSGFSELSKISGARGLLAQKYTNESYMDYSSFGRNEIMNLFAVDFHPLTPVMLTSVFSPIELIVNVYGEPDDIQVTGGTRPACYAGLWSMDRDDFEQLEVNASGEDFQFVKLVRDCSVRIATLGLQLGVLAVPGWDLNYYLKHRMSQSVKDGLRADGMVIFERILEGNQSRFGAFLNRCRFWNMDL